MPLTREQLRELSRAFPTRGAARHDPTGYETLRAAIIAAIRPFATALDFEIDTVEPLDAYNPGCAVRPEAIIDAVGKLLATLDQKEAKGK